MALFVLTFNLTHVFKNDRLSLQWAAADIKMLFNNRKFREAELKPKFEGAQSIRDYLHINTDCNLIAILNGKDKYLESIWGMGEKKRKQAFLQLKEMGFSIGTGATFSVSAKTDLGTPTPHAHNVTMLMRHHQIMDELQSAGLSVVPNLYWVDGDQNELDHWTRWLINNPQIHTVSRDFTATRQPEPVALKISEMLRLLNSTGRSFHVIIVGTGPANAPIVLRELAKAGHTGTIVTSSPIIDAISAMKYQINNGKIKKEKEYRASFSELMLHNMKVFEQLLYLTLVDIRAYYPFTCNFQHS